jgi:HEAT repeat protein
MKRAAPLDTDTLLVIENDVGDCTRASWCNVGIAVWRVYTLAPDIDAVSSLLTRLAAKHPGGVGLVQVVEVGAVVPDADARAALARMLRDGSQFIRCAAVVYLGSGFGAAAVRGVVTGLAMLSRHEFPHEVKDSVRDAATMIARHLCPEQKARTDFALHLETAIETVRAAGIAR